MLLVRALALACLLALACAAPALVASLSSMDQPAADLVVSWSDCASLSIQPTDHLVIVPEYDNAYLQPIGTQNVTLAGPQYANSGAFTLRIVSSRFGSFKFALTSGGQPVLWSNAVTLSSVAIGTPTHVHFAPGVAPTSMAVSWVSGYLASDFVFEYGTSPALGMMAPYASFSTYDITDMCAAPANTTAAFLTGPGVQFRTNLTELVPGTLYYYRISSASLGVWTNVTTFHTPPALGQPVSAFLLGDLGVYPGWDLFTDGHNDEQQPSVWTVKWAGEWLQKNPSALSVHIGDISYARGWNFIWDLFFDQISPLSTHNAYAVGIGNHEWDCFGSAACPPDWAPPSWGVNNGNGGYGNDAGGECGVPYSHRFAHMPRDSLLANPPYYYSFSAGVVHFVVVSTEQDFRPSSAQWKWLAADLAAVDRSVTPWIVLGGHRPMYTSSEQGAVEALLMNQFRFSIEPLLQKFRVQLCFWGHVHVYERTCGITSNYTCGATDNDGTVHLTVGNAGNESQGPWDVYESLDGSLHVGIPEWSIFRTPAYGWGSMSANATHLEWTMRSNARNQIHDYLVLENLVAV